MDRSTASSQSQKPSAKPRVRKIPSTPVSEIMTPPLPQSMVSPTTDTSKLSETSVGGTYLKILEDVMGRFSPSEKMSEVFSKLAEKFKEEEGQVTPSPNRTPTTVPVQVELAGQHLSVPPASQTHRPEPESARSIGQGEQEEGFTERVESAEGNNEVEDPDEDTILEPVKEKITGEGQEVIAIGEEESKDYEKIPSERATRRNLRMQRRLEEEEPRSQREEAIALTAAKKEAAERERKEK